MKANTSMETSCDVANMEIKFEKSVTSSKTGPVNYALACEKSIRPVFVTFTPNSTHEPIYVVTKGNTQFHGILDSCESDSIIGVDTLQELFEVYDALGFDPRAKIKVDRTLKKTFMFGNSAVSEAIGLAQLTVGLFGTKHVNFCMGWMAAHPSCFIKISISNGNDSRLQEWSGMAARSEKDPSGKNTQLSPHAANFELSSRES